MLKTNRFALYLKIKLLSKKPIKIPLTVDTHRSNWNIFGKNCHWRTSKLFVTYYLT